MTLGLLHLHNILRWVILILLFVALVQAFVANAGIRKTSLWLLISAHIMLVLGLYQLLAGRFGILVTTRPDTSISLMKDSFYRFFWIEHPVGMLIAIILITIARGKAKLLNYKAATWLYLVALFVILASVPWPFRMTVGRPWFPGM